ncbi:52 kDa repressor of the inhibitor of the protein kinase-like [Cydia splendana]|uniref:52 kDa repressor of the inhibitor of the protein kinase-like n=1 Tax=Cydia splendana TaxID=1100963 RepID=UPI00300DB072
MWNAKHTLLRGHRDDGSLESESSDGHGEGNFRALLKFRIDAGDEILRDHVKTCPKNASYISKSTQNDLIECCGELISNKIVNKIKKSKYFTIIADETTDVSICEQLAVCIRYFDVDTNEIQEDFLMFVEVVKLSGENIAHHILKALESLNLDITFCRGQAYDGGANMSGKIQGVQARISSIQPLAVFTHCASHRLNLALSTACTVPSIRNAVGVISSVATFFRESAQRIHLLREEMQTQLPKEKQNILKKMCETRWVERHEAVLTFLDVLPCLPDILQKMADQGNRSATSPFSLLQSIMSSEFLISLVILSDILGITLPLSRSLQATEIDIISAVQLITTTTGSLQRQRDTSTTSFNKLFNQAEAIANEIGAEITVRRITGRQTNRPNIQTQSVEEYYRLSVYIPFLDYLLSEMSSRFPSAPLQTIGQLQKLLSHNFSDEDIEDVLRGAELYKDDLPCFLALKGELKIWQQMRENIPKTPADAYKRATVLPNIRTLCQLLCTFPVTTSTAERSFSTLRRLKSYLRSRMTEERLNGLAVMHIHQDIATKMDANEVLDIFSRKHKRKLSLLIM